MDNTGRIPRGLDWLGSCIPALATVLWHITPSFIEGRVQPRLSLWSLLANAPWWMEQNLHWVVLQIPIDYDNDGGYNMSKADAQDRVAQLMLAGVSAEPDQPQGWGDSAIALLSLCEEVRRQFYGDQLVSDVNIANWAFIIMHEGHMLTVSEQRWIPERCEAERVHHNPAINWLHGAIWTLLFTATGMKGMPLWLRALLARPELCKLTKIVVPKAVNLPVEVFPKSVLIMEFWLEVGITIPVCTTQH